MKVGLCLRPAQGLDNPASGVEHDRRRQTTEAETRAVNAIGIAEHG